MSNIDYKKKITLTFTLKEWIDIANVFATADIGEREFFHVRDRKMRKNFRETWEQRHKLWLKITRATEKSILYPNKRVSQ